MEVFMYKLLRLLTCVCPCVYVCVCVCVCVCVPFSRLEFAALLKAHPAPERDIGQILASQKAGVYRQCKINACAESDMHRHRHRHRQTDTHTRTHTHARTHTRTRTHTHTRTRAHTCCACASGRGGASLIGAQSQSAGNLTSKPHAAPRKARSSATIGLSSASKGVLASVTGDASAGAAKGRKSKAGKKGGTGLGPSIMERMAKAYGTAAIVRDIAANSPACLHPSFVPCCFHARLLFLGFVSLPPKLKLFTACVSSFSLLSLPSCPSLTHSCVSPL